MAKRKFEATQHINGVSPMSNVKKSHRTKRMEETKEEIEILPLTPIDAYKIMQACLLNNDGLPYTMMNCIRRYNTEKNKRLNHLISFLEMLKAIS